MKRLAVLLTLLLAVMFTATAESSGREKQLFDYVREQNLSRLKELLGTDGINVNYMNSNDRNVLMEACVQQWYAGVKGLLEIDGINPAWRNPVGQTALMFVVKYNNDNRILSLMLSGPDPNLNNADFQGKTVLMYALDNTDVICLNHILSIPTIAVDAKDGAGRTALMYAISKKYLKGINALISKADGFIDFGLTDEDGNTVLMYAVQSKNPDILKTLLPYVAGSYATSNRKGQNPFVLACEKSGYQNEEVVRAIVNSNEFEPSAKLKDGEPAVITLIRTSQPNSVIYDAIDKMDSDQLDSIQDKRGHDMRWWAKEKKNKKLLDYLDEKEDLH